MNNVLEVILDIVLFLSLFGFFTLTMGVQIANRNISGVAVTIIGLFGGFITLGFFLLTLKKLGIIGKESR